VKGEYMLKHFVFVLLFQFVGRFASKKDYDTGCRTESQDGVSTELHGCTN
jgi:hypothetical protein